MFFNMIHFVPRSKLFLPLASKLICSWFSSIEEEAGSPTQDNWKFNYFIYTWHHSAFIPIGLDRKLCSFYENDATHLSSPGEADDKFHQLFFLFHFPFIIFPFSPLLIVLSYKLCQQKKKKIGIFSFHCVQYCIASTVITSTTMLI